MARQRIIAAIFCSTLWCITSARAQFGETAEVTQPLASTNREDPTASGTEINLRQRVAATDQLSPGETTAKGSATCSRYRQA